MEENAQQVQRTPEQDIEIIYEALSIYREEKEQLDKEIARIDATLYTIHHALHSIGNMVSGKIGMRELEFFVKQIVEESLKTCGTNVDVSNK